MNDTAREIYRLSQEGYCCSQIMVQMGLDAQGDENAQLVDAVAGLCGGLYSGLCCGTLTGAACMLSIFDKDKAKQHMIPKLVEWFQATYTQRYGGIRCDCIIDGNPMTRLERCPKIMEKTFEKCRSLLAECGYKI
ncbi:MAG: C_GCAxxG_C_C family protein [Acidobacteria bacterium]|nr:C_GCAxxG_C_C family protein [Acidobacteriota bacterium]